MILLIDNYDSFAHNLARYLVRLGQRVRIVRNDAITIDQIACMTVDAIVLSPGPCTPNEAGCTIEVVRRFSSDIPILGVCLGHQTIAAALGANIIRATEPMHGRVSEVFHDQQGIFLNLPNPFSVGRYHSLIVDETTLPDSLMVTARTSTGEIMAIRHNRCPVVGMQFHPESILTNYGYQLLSGFLRMAKLEFNDEHIPTIDSEMTTRIAELDSWPSRPVTF